jgi:hypothetical protein
MAMPMSEGVDGDALLLRAKFWWGWSKKVPVPSFNMIFAQNSYPRLNTWSTNQFTTSSIKNTKTVYIETADCSRRPTQLLTNDLKGTR